MQVLAKSFFKNIQSVSIYLVFTLCFSLISFVPRAEALEDPLAMLRTVTNTVMADVMAHRESLRRSPQRLYDLVDQQIVPHADFVEMSKWVLGRNAWNKTDAATQEVFVKEFKTLVIRSYSSAILNYSDQDIQYLPMRESYETKQRIKIASIVRGSDKTIRMDYLLLRVGDVWKVYDIVIEGVSLMQGFHAQFSDDLKRGGVKTVIEKIKQHNAEPRRAA